MPERIHRIFLTDQYILAIYLRNVFSRLDAFKTSVLLAERRIETRQPDHAIRHRLQAALDDVPSVGQAVRVSLQNLAEGHLRFRGDKLYVREERLADWQNLLTTMSPVVLASVAAWLQFGVSQAASDTVRPRARWDGEYATWEQMLLQTFSHATLPPGQNAFLEDLAVREGLVELHMHLNGTTEADFVWQFALSRPKLMAWNLRKAANGKFRVQEFLAQHQLTSVWDYYLLLLKARRLRDFIVRILLNRPGRYRNGQGQERQSDDSEHSYSSRAALKYALTAAGAMDSSWIALLGGMDHPMAVAYPCQFPCGGGKSVRLVRLEALMLARAFRHLGRGHDVFDRALHIYLLLQSRCQRLIVQQAEQFGFDQFQKIPENDLRCGVEQRYEDRFHQLHGMHGPTMGYVEGRFAPKDTRKSNFLLLKGIREGYDKAFRTPERSSSCPRCRPPVTVLSERTPSRPFDLALVAHFIKTQQSGKDDGVCRHYKLRQSLMKKGRALLRTRQLHPEFAKRLVGADAANNELDAPPEVFAPLFRLLRRGGLCKFTYHVGEDFITLPSGLRAVHEAIDFLELQAGDRIGHGTALGMDPGYWLRCRNNTLHCARGEWLDNLIWAYGLLRYKGHCLSACQQLRDDIRAGYRELWGTAAPDVDLLIEAWQLRHLDPLAALSLDGDMPSLGGWDVEADRVRQSKRNLPEAFDIFKRYHTKPQKKWNEIIPVSKHPFTVPVLQVLQDAVIKMTCQKCIAVEVMPTSNLRISDYEHIYDHHVFRWLNNKGGRPVPTVVIASDDPGIFATNLRNEMGLIHKGLCQMEGLDETRANNILQDLHDTARRYRFGLGLPRKI
ncbi:hypothetical protein K9F62_19815 [Desulfovibrio sp. JY]|nr:hypothetical protein K9F62_19815 [Desulfovibrio sp. JY]